ncbi:MAG: GAF domain-containing protein [Chitinophagaceae bacterium]
MKNGILLVNKSATSENSVESVVSFKKFTDFLEEKVSSETSIRTHFFRFVLDKINAYPELAAGIPAAAVAKYEQVLELVSSIVFPLIEDEEQVLFGLTSGISPEAFYASNAFHRLFESRPEEENNVGTWLAKESNDELHQQMQYDLILQKVYGFALPQKKEMVRSFFNEQTGLYQYFRVNIDTRFVEVKLKAKNGENEITDNRIAACFECSNGFAELEKLVPLKDFTSTGFSIVTLTDITEQQSIEQLSRAIVGINKPDSTGDFIHITRLLQTLLGNSHYKFGIMPFFTVNNRAALLYENFPYSILVKASWDAGIPKPVFTKYINHYIKDPDIIIYSQADETSELPKPLQEALKKAGYQHYRIAPVYFNDVLVGIIETATTEEGVLLTDVQFAKLKPAIYYIGQLLKQVIDIFNVAIDTIVKDKFTVIQPSVQWKFNEVAWHYYRSNDIEHKNNALEKISFKNVYPLYGAVDFRNSTVERNKALREDLQLQLALVMELLPALGNNGSGDVAAVETASSKWLEKMTDYVSVEEELQINEFLFTKVNPLLATFTGLEEPFAEKIAAYFNAIDEQTGAIYNKRWQLENSIRTLNKSISKYFDSFKEELQQYYPCYFEKLRTDGTEYDIYIGQSIAPKIPFSLTDVEKLRLWQVESMTNIARITNALIPRLEYPLQTTQLIFVNARTIDISFRNDERRFDVEGAYNIRYHIIKKRIDKVNIFNSTERLTQPGKIAIVYFNEKDAEEYMGYIKQLQQKQLLLDDLEHLQLEELQGVAGLKALRVGVRLD